MPAPTPLPAPAMLAKRKIRTLLPDVKARRRQPSEINDSEETSEYFLPSLSIMIPLTGKQTKSERYIVAMIWST